MWKYRLAGTLALMAGDGGIGKSRILLMIATAVSTGGAWPDGSGNAPKGNVVLVSAKDSAKNTIKPTLMAIAGANMSTELRIVKAAITVQAFTGPPRSPAVATRPWLLAGCTPEPLQRDALVIR